MSDRIRVGLIGYGYASKTFHAPLIAGTRVWNWQRYQVVMKQKLRRTGRQLLWFQNRNICLTILILI